MSKFKVFQSLEANLAWLGIRFNRMVEPTNEFFTSFMPYYLLIVSISSVISSGVFIYSNWPNLEIIFQSSSIVFLGLIQSTGIFLSFGLRMKQVKKLHFRLQDIVDEQGKLYSCSFYCLKLR